MSRLGLGLGLSKGRAFSPFDPLSLNPILAFEAEKSMLAAGDAAAANLDLVATLENRAFLNAVETGSSYGTSLSGSLSGSTATHNQVAPDVAGEFYRIRFTASSVAVRGRVRYRNYAGNADVSAVDGLGSLEYFYTDGAYEAYIPSDDGLSLWFYPESGWDYSGVSVQQISKFPANATQTTASYQPRAHVPLGDGHLYLSGVSGNYASVPNETNLNILGDMEMQWFGEHTSGVQETLIAKWGTGSNNYIIRTKSNDRLQFYRTSQYAESTTATSSDAVGFKVTHRVSDDRVQFFETTDGNSWSQVGADKTIPAHTPSSGTSVVEVGSLGGGTQNPLSGLVKRVILKDGIDGSSVLDIDFSTGDHKASSFDCSTGQTVTINTSGDDPATIVRKSFMRMDLVDDEYEFTTGSAVNGTIVVATLEGTYSANISLNASTQYDLQARGVASSPNHGFLKNPVGYLVSSSPLSESEITKVENYFVDKGAAARSAFGSVTNFSNTWDGCNSLTSFPLIDTSSGTKFSNAWYNCVSLTSFPLIDTSSATNILGAWRACSSLTSFPLINTSLVTNFINAWKDCSSLTSFPLINTESGTNFTQAWRSCSSLTTFPAGVFDNWSPSSISSGVFDRTWDGCTSLTAQSVENILTSLDTSGVYGTDTGASGGTQLADNTIDIDYDGTTLSSATTTAISNLKTKDWAININNVIQ